jgi:UDP:flavonoid glycosyltransferase YjiC (YdhE family)
MAHIAMVSIPAPGHVNPSLEIIRELVNRGHRVTYANDAAWAETVRGVGAELVPYESTLPFHREIRRELREEGGTAHAATLVEQLLRPRR